MIIKIFIFICEIQLASGSKGLRCLIMLGTRNRGNCGHVSHDRQTAGRPPPSSGTYNVLLNTVRQRHHVSHSGGRGISISPWLTLCSLLALRKLVSVLGKRSVKKGGGGQLGNWGEPEAPTPVGHKELISANHDGRLEVYLSTFESQMRPQC